MFAARLPLDEHQCEAVIPFAPDGLKRGRTHAALLRHHRGELSDALHARISSRNSRTVDMRARSIQAAAVSAVAVRLMAVATTRPMGRPSRPKSAGSSCGGATVKDS